MYIKYKELSDQDSHSQDNIGNQNLLKSNKWKARIAQQAIKQQYRKKLFGQYYNYGQISLNKQKKYLFQEQKKTQIQRQNLILLSKMQKIAKRSALINLKKRLKTDLIDRQDSQISRQQSIIEKIEKFASAKTQRQEIKQNQDKQNSSQNVKRVLFKQEINETNKIKKIKTKISGQDIILEIKFNNKEQKIKINKESYKLFFQNQLKKDHKNIKNFLKFNGNFYKLLGLDDYQISIEDSKDSFPLIHSKKEKRINNTQKKNKSYTMNT